MISKTKRITARGWWCAAGLALMAIVALPTRSVAALPMSAENSALRLTVLSITASPTYGSARAAVGNQFVVLSTSWENRIDEKLAKERGLATVYSIPELENHLYLIKDGQWRGELRMLKGAAAKMSLNRLTVSKPEPKVTGEVVFELPEGMWSSLELRFYDDTTGYLAMSLAGAAPAVKPLFPLQKNEIAELGVFGFENPAKGVTAPAGFRAVAVDLRARSVWTVEGEAPLYDGKLPLGSRNNHLNMLDWTETKKYLHVLADGDFAYPPEATSTVPDTARFIPEFLTGGRLVFFVPADAKSLELFCEMPHAAAPGSSVIDLPPMDFPLVGSGTPSTAAKPVLSIQDEMLAVGVEPARRVPTFAGAKAPEGKQWLAFTVSVSNQGTTGEFFQPRDQLLMVDGDGAEVPLDEVTMKSPHRPEDLVHLPVGSRRRFEVVYAVDAKITAPKLSFHGGSFMQAYDLPLKP